MTSETRQLQQLFVDDERATDGTDTDAVRPPTLQYCSLRLVQTETKSVYTVQLEDHTDALLTVDVREFEDVFALIDHLNHINTLAHVYEYQLPDDEFADWAGKKLTPDSTKASIRPELYQSDEEIMPSNGS